MEYILATIVLFLLFFLLRQRRKMNVLQTIVYKDLPKISKELGEYKKQIQALKARNQALLLARNSQNVEKGYQFEQCVVQKFNTKYFKLKVWSSDKFINGIYAEENQNPDLRLEFMPESTSEQSVFEIAIECKYRQYWYKNEIHWAKEDQLLRYQTFENMQKVLTFVVIGVGGFPSLPDEVFVLPLQKIKSNVLNKNELLPFLKTNFKQENFFFDHKNKILA